MLIALQKSRGSYLRLQRHLKHKILQNRHKYVNKMKAILSCTQACSRVQEDPSKKPITKLSTTVQNYDRNGMFTLDCKRFLDPTETSCDRAYGTPNIHKKNQEHTIYPNKFTLNRQSPNPRKPENAKPWNQRNVWYHLMSYPSSTPYRLTWRKGWLHIYYWRTPWICHLTASLQIRWRIQQTEHWGTNGIANIRLHCGSSDANQWG